MTEKLFGIIETRIGLGSVLVIGTQAVFWVAYVSINLAQMKEIKATVDSMQQSIAVLSVATPVQSERVIEMGRRLDGLEHTSGDLTNRVGLLEQRNAGIRSDIDLFRSQLQTLQASSDAPIRKPR